MKLLTLRSDGENLDVYGNTEQDVVDVEGVINKREREMHLVVCVVHWRRPCDLCQSVLCDEYQQCSGST